MKKEFYFLIFLCSYNTILFSQNPATDFAGGCGTQTNPYQITTETQLSNLNNYLGTDNDNNLKHYRLMNDIDLSAISWIPIATVSSPFCGKLHGGGKNIIGLNIGQEATPVTYQYTGLFAVLGDGAYIDSIIISSGNIRSGINMEAAYTGAIAGYAVSTTGITISRCINNSLISGSSTNHTHIGGILGYCSSVENCLIEYCSNNSDITSANESITSSDTLNVGGIIGCALGGTNNIQYCRNIGNLHVSNAHIANVGGIAGYTSFNNEAYMQNCYSYCQITNTANGNSGGLVGYVYGSGASHQLIIRQSYTAGSIQSGSQTNVGIVGLFESNNENGYLMIQNCVAAQEFITGRISGTNRILGTFAEDATILSVNNFGYENMLVNGAAATGYADDKNGKDISMHQAFSQSFYTDTASWSIASTWLIQDGKSFPYFSGESAPVYIPELYRDSLVLDFINNSDSLIIIDQENYVRKEEFINQSSGTATHELNLLNKKAGDIIIFSNYEADKQPSYPLWKRIDKRNITVNINDTSKCLGATDPSFTYKTVPLLNTLPSQDSIQLIGILQRSFGEESKNYEITADFVFNSNNSDNYTVSIIPGTLTILAPDTTSLLPNSYVWLGKESDDINEAVNWIIFDGLSCAISNTLPDNTSNVFFKSYYDCISNTARLAPESTLAVNDITIETSLNLDSNTNITVYGNWDNSGIFNSYTGTVIFAGNQPQAINPGSGNFYNVLFSNTYKNNNDIAITAPMFIEGSATFENGIIYFENTGTINFLENSLALDASTNSFVNGPVTKIGSSDFLFPIGDIRTRNFGNGDVLYKVIGLLSIPSLPETAQVTAEYHYTNENKPDQWSNDGNTDSTIHHVSDKEYWTINSSHNLNNITFCWKENIDEGGICMHGFDYGDSTAFNPYDLSIAYWNGSKWTNIGASGHETVTHHSGCIQTQNTITFGAKAETYITFASVDGETPLPITLLSFTAECNNNKSALSWQTSSETNNTHFIIEKSKNMTDFYTLAKIPGAGNSNNINTYSFIDNENSQGNNYYCLKHVDFNGTTNIKGYLSSNCHNSKKEEPTIFPNPFTNKLNISFNNFHNKSFTIEIFNTLGQCVFNEIYPNHNESIFNISQLSNIPSSKYLIRVKSDDFVFTKTIIKL